MKEKRARVRMLLGRWGGWTLLLARLRREQRAARDWLREEDSPPARELLGHIDREIADLLRLRETLTALVNGLTMDEQRVLMLRYETGLNWLQISLKMNYDERSVRRIETRAVDAIASALEG